MFLILRNISLQLKIAGLDVGHCVSDHPKRAAVTRDCGAPVIPLYGIDAQKKGPPEIADSAGFPSRASGLGQREIAENVTRRRRRPAAPAPASAAPARRRARAPRAPATPAGLPPRGRDPAARRPGCAAHPPTPA